MKNKLRFFAAFGVAVFLLSACTGETELQDPTLAEQYFTFTMNGQTFSATTPSDSIGATRITDSTVLFGHKMQGIVSVMASFKGGDTTGSRVFDTMRIHRFGQEYYSSNTPIQATLTRYGPVGDYVTGSYSGTLKSSVGTETFSVSGVFKLKRKQ